MIQRQLKSNSLFCVQLPQRFCCSFTLTTAGFFEIFLIPIISNFSYLLKGNFHQQGAYPVLDKLAIGKRLKLSPAFPLLRTERASFPAFGGPSTDMY
jgi:hypothetical protein